MNIKFEAIANLTKGKKCQLSCNDDIVTLEWLDETHTEPTETEINTEVTRLQAEFDSQQYVRDRFYPDMGDQLDMLFHELKDTGSISATGTWATMIQGVKDGSPKPTN
jgi:hypothetical protein